MQKQLTIAVAILASGVVFAGNAAAQTTPATPPAATAPKTTQSTAAKPKSSATTAATKTPAAKGTTTSAALATQKAKVSYAIGLNFGRSMQKNLLTPSDVETSAIARGVQDGLSGNKPQLTDEQMQAALSAFQQDVSKRQEASMAQAGEANKKAGDEFLAANKAKPGVVTLPDGLQYKIITQGTGPKPTKSDTVVCNYRGTLIDGKEFDSSYKRGQPASFPVGGVIPAWTEALQLMPVGSKWQLFIPSELAYGQRGAGPDIGPNSTLIFDVELISIQGK